MTVLAALFFQALGDPIPEDPLQRLIQYLGRHQNEDGSWGEAPPGCCCLGSHSLDLGLRVVPDDETIRCFEYLREGLPSDLPSERERSEKALFRLGLPIVPLLQESGTHPDPEVRWRCRQALGDLWRRDSFVHAAFRETRSPGTEDFELKATGLALLALCGGGYSHFSKDRIPDPLRPQGCHLVGEMILKGLQSLIQRQRSDGSFGASHAEGNVYPALALVEAYSLTYAPILKDHAISAVEYVGGLKSEEPLARLWKEFVLESARSVELPAPGRSPEALIGAFEAGVSTIDVSAAVILSSFAKRPAGAARARLRDLPPEPSTAEERFYGLLAINRAWKIATPERRTWMDRHPCDWRKQQILDMECDRGAWPEVSGRFEWRMLATLYTALAFEQYYGYPCALLVAP